MILDDGLDLSQNPTQAVAELPWTAAYEFQGQTYSSEDGSHGTLTFSVAGARNNGTGIVGVAPNAVMHYGDIQPGGLGLGWQSAAAAIIDAALPETKVISISYSSKQTYLPSGFTALYDEIQSAYNQRGILIVASTGNQESSSIQAYPARWAEVIGVGGATTSDTWIHNNYASGNVEVAAPSVAIGIVCKGGALRGTASGTSFATPAVAGALMLMRQKYPSLSNAEIRSRLAATALPMASTLKSGAGRIDILAALNYQPPPPPLSVTISPPSLVQVAGNYTWTANASGGSSGYTYVWEESFNGGPFYQAGTGSAYTRYVDLPDEYFDLRVTATSGAQTGTTTKRVTIAIF